MQREGFGSRIGFLLVSAGCAIGIGNIWKFPYMVGQNGGGIFVLFYLLFLIVMGIPILTMELAVGRASRLSVVKSYRKLEPQGTKWHVHGWLCVAGSYLLMMYYTTVSGWMLSYFIKFLTGRFDNLNTEAAETIFNNMLASPREMGLAMAVTVVLGFLVCSLGLEKGIEKITTIMMACLLGLIAILVVHSFSMSGAREGIAFYLTPDISRVKDIGIANVINSAMSQAFFTLSVGIASMEIFGSYMSDEHTLATEAANICVLDTFVAIMAGLIIFPACFSFGVKPDAGPSLIFLTLPKVFISMPGGRIWGTLFFLFMTFASFSTVIAVFENLISNSIENFNFSRKKAAIVNCIFLLIASMPCVLGYNLWSDLHIIGGRDVLDSEDFIVSNILLPGGALTYLIFCVTKWGWGFDSYIAECNKGDGVKIPRACGVYLKYILPIMILALFVSGL